MCKYFRLLLLLPIITSCGYKQTLDDLNLTSKKSSSLQQENFVLQEKNQQLVSSSSLNNKDKQRLTKENNDLIYDNRKVKEENNLLAQQNEVLRQEREAVLAQTNHIKQENYSLVYKNSLLDEKVAEYEKNESLIGKITTGNNSTSVQSLLKNYTSSNYTNGDIKNGLEKVKLALFVNDVATAETLLNSISKHASLKNDKQNLIAVQSLSAKVLAKNNLFIDSAIALISINHLLSPQDQLANQEVIWDKLMHATIYKLKKSMPQIKHNLYLPWFELAYAVKKNKYNIKQRSKAVTEWLHKWPNHNMQVILNNIVVVESYVSLSHVALLLPLSGNKRLKELSNAIVNGFLAAYFDAQVLDLNITVIDSVKYNNNIIDAVQLAKNKGVQVIIGPLQKKHIYKLQQYNENLPLPVLALNYGNLSHRNNPSNLLQFGLLPENEVQNIIQRAWAENKKRAVVLGLDNKWGTRLSNYFIQAWQDLGGSIVANKKFSNKSNYSQLISALLEIPLSDIRHFKHNKIDMPSHRRDIDFIFLAALPNQAQRINSMLNYYLASSIPIYTTSTVLSSKKQDNFDIDNIYLTTIPWLFGAHNVIQKTIYDHWLDYTIAVKRMHAFGVDAFMLSALLPNIAVNKSYHKIDGATGELNIHNSGLVSRNLIWSKINQGILKAVVTKDQPTAWIYELHQK